MKKYKVGKYVVTAKDAVQAARIVSKIDSKKYVIFKQNGVYKMTTEENYARPIQNAREITTFNNMTSKDEIIEYVEKYLGGMTGIRFVDSMNDSSTVAEWAASQPGSGAEFTIIDKTGRTIQKNQFEFFSDLKNGRYSKNKAIISASHGFDQRKQDQTGNGTIWRYTINLLDSSATSTVADTELVVGKTFTTKSGHKLKVTKVVSGYSEYNGNPEISINYDYEKTDGAKGSAVATTKDFFNMMQDSLKDSGPRYLVTAIFKKPFNQYNTGDKIEHTVEGESAAANTRAFLSGNYRGYVNVTLRRLRDSKMFNVTESMNDDDRQFQFRCADAIHAIQEASNKNEANYMRPGPIKEAISHLNNALKELS